MQPSLRRPRLRRTTALIAGITLCVAGGSAVVAGFASSLGSLTSRALQSFSTTMIADAPVVATCDNFDGPDAPMLGRVVTSATKCGSITWTVDQGDWSVTAGLAVSDGSTDASASLPALLVDATVVASITGVGTSSQRGGVVLDSDGAGTYLAAVVVGDAPVRVDLVLMAAGVPTTLASADIVIEATTSVALTRSGSDVHVSIDGVQVVTFALSAGDIAVLGAGDRAGLYASSASAQFDNLRVTSPTLG